MSKSQKSSARKGRSASQPIKAGSTREARRSHRAAIRASRSSKSRRSRKFRGRGIDLLATAIGGMGNFMGVAKFVVIGGLLALLIVSFLAGCAPTQAPNAGTWVDDRAEVQPAKLEATLYRVVDGETVPIDLFTASRQLARNYDVVFFGELHGHVPCHAAEHEFLRTIAHLRDGDVTLSMEQWERDTQQYLDGWMSGKITSEELLVKSRPWPNWRDYWPLLREARNWGMPVIAANIPRRYASQVFRQGPGSIEQLPAEERAWCAREITTADGEYKERFFQFAGRRDENFFAAQAIKDDTMAESIVDHLAANPGRLVFHVNGRFHSDAWLGTVERVKLRAQRLRLGVITTVPSEDGSIPDGAASEGDYLLVVSPPPQRAPQARPAVPPGHGKGTGDGEKPSSDTQAPKPEKPAREPDA